MDIKCDVCGKNFKLEEPYYALDFPHGNTFRFCTKKSCMDFGCRMSVALEYLQSKDCEEYSQVLEELIFNAPEGEPIATNLAYRLLKKAISVCRDRGMNASETASLFSTLKPDMSEETNFAELVASIFDFSI